MLSPVGLTDNQSDFKLQLDRIVEREREAHQNGNPPKGACLIHVPDYQPYFYTDLTPRAAGQQRTQSKPTPGSSSAAGDEGVPGT